MQHTLCKFALRPRGISVLTLPKMAFSCPPERLLRDAQRPSLSSRFTGGQTRSGSTYRASMLTELGKPLQIQQLESIDDVPAGHVRINVHNAAVNFADILICQGKYQEKPMLPFSPGNELAGEVAAVGPDVTNVKPGDRVFGVSSMGGGFSEQAICAANSIHVIPDGMPSDIACSLLIVYGTAMMALQRRANIQEGDTVLVTSAAGGVGLATVDLAANYFKAKVIGACGSDEKCKVAASRGASATINYNRENLSERVKELTKGKGANIIADNVGGDMFKHCLKSVAFEGRILIIGFASGDIPKIPANLLLVKSCSAVGVYWGSYSRRHPKAFMESIQGVLEAYEQKKIQPHISKTFPLEKVNEAFQYVLDRKSTGKVVMNCRE